MGFGCGQVFRAVDRGDRVRALALSEKVVWQLLQQYAVAIGAQHCSPRPSPHMREDVQGGRRRTGADPIASWSRLGTNDRAILWHEAGLGTYTERWNQVEARGLKWVAPSKSGWT